MVEAMDSCHGNPSSLHRSGQSGRALLETSRDRILNCINGGSSGGERGNLVFTSGGSESNRLAIMATLEVATVVRKTSREGVPEAAKDLPHAVVSMIEHPSTLEVYRRLEEKGLVDISWVAPGEDGRISPSRICQSLRPDTVLVSLHHANNETGVLQDIQGVARDCHSRGVLLHCDAVQTLGKVVIQIGELGPDLVSMSAHKAYGPKGTGLLWIRNGLSVKHPWGGGPQEKGLRPGTENLPGVVGFAEAVDRIEISDSQLRDRLWARIQEGCPNAILNGSIDFLIPNTLNVSFLGLRAEILLIMLDLEGVQASSGSACASGAREPSHVLQAMDLPEERISSAVRFSLGRGITTEDVDRASEVIRKCVNSQIGSSLIRN